MRSINRPFYLSPFLAMFVLLAWSVSNGGVSELVSGHSVPSPQDSGLSWQLT